MILLDPANRILGETVGAIFKNGPKKMDIRLCDFDDTSFHVTCTDEAKDASVSISMSLPCYREVEEFGGKEAMEQHFKRYISEPPQGFDVSLKIPVAEVEDGEKLSTEIASMKALAVGGVFSRFFRGMLQKKPLEKPYHFNIRGDTSAYIFPRTERTTVVFLFDFTERVDLAIARVFLQEFVESRRHLGHAPPCAFNLNPPMELKEFGITEPQGNLGFITFVIMPEHVDSGKLERVSSILQNFRNYLQYHIKCAKAHFHQRMRARIKSLLKVLKRAKMEVTETKKKTYGGKTFERKF